MKIIFFDREQKIVDSMKQKIQDIKNRYLSIDVFVEKFDVRQLVDKNPSAVVSPANSLGYMDGGIDLYLMKCIPGIQSIVQQKIKNIGYMFDSSHKYIPVGSGFLTETKCKSIPYLFCIPTMETPKDISDHPENIYKATLAFLFLLYKNPELKMYMCLD